jgi:hypothetical protein
MAAGLSRGAGSGVTEPGRPAVPGRRGRLHRLRRPARPRKGGLDARSCHRAGRGFRADSHLSRAARRRRGPDLGGSGRAGQLSDHGHRRVLRQRLRPGQRPGEGARPMGMARPVRGERQDQGHRHQSRSARLGGHRASRRCLAVSHRGQLHERDRPRRPRRHPASGDRDSGAALRCDRLGGPGARRRNPDLALGGP